MWNREVDVIVIGYGGAGATAAITAFDQGADVLIVEKSAQGGGNTKYSGGTIRTYTDQKSAGDFFEDICEGTTEREVIDAFVQESAQNPDWLREIGAETSFYKESGEGFPIRPPGAAFPHLRGAEAIGPRLIVKGSGHGGRNLWAILSHNVEIRKIPILYSSAVTRLLPHASEGATGIIVTSSEGELRVRAKRAVIVCCGGYENDTSFHLNYLGQKFLSLGHSGNTGDGIRMAAELGADLWHMNAVAATLGYKVPDFDFPIRHRMVCAGFIYVDQTGKRFVDETGIDGHAMWAPTSYIDMKTLSKPRIPCYVLFDESTRTSGPVAETTYGKASDFYQWSRDNSVEVQKGWIKTGLDLAALADQIKVSPDSLQSTITQYNLYCSQGSDADFDRAPTTLLPIVKSPFYAIAMWPSLINTQGGPKRNSRGQVLDVWGRPIKRLYSAGELGSLWHRYYPGSGNVSEALASGRIAGKNAAAESPTL